MGALTRQAITHFRKLGVSEGVDLLCLPIAIPCTWSWRWSLGVVRFVPGD